MKNMEKTRSGFIAIVGKPNVGKSSLLNQFLGEKLAIVSSKPQTTRNRITGVLTDGPDQIVFIDTPGLHKPKTKLGEYMVGQVNDSVTDVDAILFVAEPAGDLTQSEHDLIDIFEKLRLPVVLVINKIDILREKDSLLARIAQLSILYPFDAVIPVSALTHEGVDELLEQVKGYLCEGPHFFPDDALTDQPERVIVSEIVREKLLRNLRDEIPHGTAVSVEKMKERENADMIDIDVTIFCEKDSHKGMIIGKGGRMLKKIASESRTDIERFLGAKINLQCWVKVKDDWRNKEGIIRSLGYM